MTIVSLMLRMMSCFAFFLVSVGVNATSSMAEAKPAKKSLPKAASKTEDKVRLALNWKPEPQFGGFYAAHIAELDKKSNIELELVPGGAGTPVVQMVAAGQFDFGIASADEVIVSRARGSDVVALFASYQTNPQAILTHAERSFESLSDVFKSDGTIAMQKGLPYAIFLQRKYAGVMKASLVPYLGGISNFLSRADHSQQCFVTAEPFLARKQGSKVKTFLVAESGFNPYTTVLITRRSVLNEKPELVKNVVAAVRAGWRRYLDQPDDINMKMHELNPSIDIETFRLMSDAQKPLVEVSKDFEVGSMTEARWDELAVQLESMKIIDQKPAAKNLFIKF
jgi:NitT/TauT family transport system substrate-binding protein